MYEEMLSRAQNYKKDLEKDYNKLTQDEQSIFNKIKTQESIRGEIQNNINEINEKKAAIEVRKKGL
ncbi:MAG: hypothetical protein PR2021_2570 [Candidatus Phytoplasma pruni]|nr:MAG: hypothetical protein PR2021_2570 [Candidatus Phytoplasma pruni]